MKLTILKELPHISPSSFIAWRNCSYKIWIEKCSGIKLKEQESSRYALVGTAFDLFVKIFIARQNGWTLNSGEQFKTLSMLAADADTIPAGLRLAKLYLAQSHPDMWRITNCFGSRTAIFEGIPLFGYPDAEIHEGGIFIPLDWKTSGFESTYKQSPKPGYRICYTLYPYRNIFKSNHKRCREPIDHYLKDWATQLLFYWWMCNPTNITDSPRGKIHHLVQRPDDVILSIYDGYISDEFVDKTKKDLHRMWDQFQGVEINVSEPFPSQHKCWSYQQLCRVAQYCTFFRNWYVADCRERGVDPPEAMVKPFSFPESTADISDSS